MEMILDCDIGVIGLGVMGRNLALNLLSRGYRVAAYDQAPESTQALAAAAPVVACADTGDLVAALKPPRAILLMIPAGEPVEAQLASLAPRLDPGDLIIDGGNSHYLDTGRRAAALATRGLGLLGVGISGGETGAREGPAIMVGGPPDGFTRMRPLLEAIAARAGVRPCCGYFGADGAGHFVKMMHNGIEYADMQLIAETVFLLRHRLGLEPAAIADRFTGWKDGALGSFLVEVTAHVLRRVDDATGRPLVDMILDRAGQKGTGQCASVAALELGVPAPTIIEAVAARALSALRPERVAAETAFGGARTARAADPLPADSYRDALMAAKICAYAQGFAVIDAARRAYGWALDLATVAQVWQGGCIIRARLLDDIAAAFSAQPALPNLMLVPSLRDRLTAALPAWRRVVGDAVASGIPVPALSSALGYLDTYRTGRLWADLIQAQRDYFGAHGFERIDQPGSFHGDWAKP